MTMTNLFFGYLFSLLNITTNLKTFTYDLLPDFIGYIFLAKAARQLAKDSALFKKTILPCYCMVGVSAIAWVVFGVNAWGEVPYLGTARSVITMLSQLALIAILYCQIKGLGEIETQTGYSMQTFRLRSDWMLVSISGVLTCLSIYGSVMMIAGYAKLIFSVVFLLHLNTTVKAYTEQEKESPEEKTPDYVEAEEEEKI